MEDSSEEDQPSDYAVLNFDGVDDAIAEVAKRAKRFSHVPMLFLIQTVSASKSKIAPSEEARRIKKKHRFNVVPIALLVMERALKNGVSDATLSDAKEKYVTRQDPYFESIPISDPNLFFGRTEQLQIIPSLLSQGQHVGIFGLRKTGKTSLAKQLQLRFRDVPVVSISCQEIGDLAASQVLLRIASELRDELRERFSVRDRSDSNGDQREQLRSLIGTWLGLGHSEPCVVILDEIDTLLPFGDPNAQHYLAVEGQRLLGILRALSQELRGLVLLAIAYRPDINRINHLPASAGENPLFMAFHEVYSGALSPEDCDTMVRELGSWRDIEWDSTALRGLYEYCGGHPFVARLFASDACREGQRKKITVGDVQSTADMIRRTMRRHRIRGVYDQVIESLSAQEVELVRLIASSSKPLKEERIPGDLEQALTDLEFLGLVVSNGRIDFAARLFKYWAKRRLIG